MSKIPGYDPADKFSCNDRCQDCIIPLSHFHNIKGIRPSRSPFSIIPVNVTPYDGPSVLVGESGRISAISMPLSSPAPDSAIS